MAAVAAVAVAAAVGLTLLERLHGAEAWTRVGLVLMAGLASCLVAHVRTCNETALAQADRVAGLSHAPQQGLLPSLRDTAAVEVRAVYRPTQHDLVVGGDFVDAIPAAWLRSLDELVRSQDGCEEEDRLATVCAGLLEPALQRLTVASAGHPRPVLLGTPTTTVDVHAGPPLGLPEAFGGGWRNEVVTLDPEFFLLAYTDGLVEGRRSPGSATRYGEESLAAWLEAQHARGGLDHVALDRLLADVQAANGGPLGDDVALVVLTHRTATGCLGASTAAARC